MGKQIFLITLIVWSSLNMRPIFLFSILLLLSVVSAKKGRNNSGSNTNTNTDTSTDDATEDETEEGATEDTSDTSSSDSAYAATVKALIDSGTCSSTSVTSNCGDSATG